MRWYSDEVQCDVELHKISIHESRALTEDSQSISDACVHACDNRRGRSEYDCSCDHAALQFLGTGGAIVCFFPVSPLYLGYLEFHSDSKLDQCIQVNQRMGAGVMNVMFARYRFSATVLTGDAAVLHCLIGLCQWAQRGEQHPQIAWGGCGQKEWQKRGGEVTFRFTSCERREAWRAKANQLLKDRWALTSMKDDDPAPDQNYRQPIYRRRDVRKNVAQTAT
jgi:hypothetical protein